MNKYPIGGNRLSRTPYWINWQPKMFTLAQHSFWPSQHLVNIPVKWHKDIFQLNPTQTTVSLFGLRNVLKAGKYWVKTHQAPGGFNSVSNELKTWLLQSDYICVIVRCCWSSCLDTLVNHWPGVPRRQANVKPAYYQPRVVHWLFLLFL